MLSKLFVGILETQLKHDQHTGEAAAESTHSSVLKILAQYSLISLMVKMKELLSNSSRWSGAVVLPKRDG